LAGSIFTLLWTRTTISSSKKLFALRKTKSCSGSLATLATATALPGPPHLLLNQNCLPLFHQSSDSKQALKDVIQADGSTTRFFQALGH